MEEKDVQFFMDNGYVILKNAVDRSFCDKLIENAYDVIHANYGKNASDNYYNIKVASYNPNIKDFKNTMGLSYNFENNINDVLNKIAGTNVHHKIHNGSSIASFKTDNNDLNWHIDGWEHHWLNQPLHVTVVLAYTDTNEGTWVAPESIKMLTDLMFNFNFMIHPELLDDYSPLPQYIINKCKDIRQLSLTKGDMLIMHPLLLHSASNNKTQDIRLVNNFHIYREINFKNPISLVEMRTKKDLSELNLDPNNYTIDLNKNLSEYQALILRNNHDDEYNLIKTQLIYFQKNNIILDKDYKNIIKNNFNEDNNEILDNYNRNILGIKKEHHFHINRRDL